MFRVLRPGGAAVIVDVVSWTTLKAGGDAKARSGQAISQI